MNFHDLILPITELNGIKVDFEPSELIARVQIHEHMVGKLTIDWDQRLKNFAPGEEIQVLNRSIPLRLQSPKSRRGRRSTRTARPDSSNTV